MQLDHALANAAGAMPRAEGIDAAVAAAGCTLMMDAMESSQTLSRCVKSCGGTGCWMKAGEATHIGLHVYIQEGSVFKQTMQSVVLCRNEISSPLLWGVAQ